MIILKIDNIIGITGSPGTGKKTIGKILAEKMEFQYLDLNKVAIEEGAVTCKKIKTLEVDINKLRIVILRKIKDKKVIISGHLLANVLKRNEISFIAILRCSPYELEKRYLKRKYQWSKIKDNIAAELLDISFYEAVNTFGEDVSAEFNTTHRIAEEVAKDIFLTINGKKKRILGNVNWLSDSKVYTFIRKYLA